MLKEIHSEVFKSHGVVRPAIKFYKDFNIVKGPDSCDNSIGKPNFLMVIDFVYGGSDYIDKLKDVHRHIEDHYINFTFKFDEVLYHFSRSTANPSIVEICNSKYEKTDTQMTLSHYTQWLKERYLITNQLTFRDIVSRYLSRTVLELSLGGNELYGFKW